MSIRTSVLVPAEGGDTLSGEGHEHFNGIAVGRRKHVTAVTERNLFTLKERKKERKKEETFV